MLFRLVPVIRVRREDIGTADDRGLGVQHVGTRADRHGAGCRALPRLRALLGPGGLAQVGEEGGVRLLQLDHEFRRAFRRGRRHVDQEPGVVGRALLEGFEVLGRDARVERRPVGELDAGPQRHGQDGLVGVIGPRRGQVRLDDAGGRGLHQAVVDRLVVGRLVAPVHIRGLEGGSRRDDAERQRGRRAGRAAAGGEHQRPRDRESEAGGNSWPFSSVEHVRCLPGAWLCYPMNEGDCDLRCVAGAASRSVPEAKSGEARLVERSTMSCE